MIIEGRKYVRFLVKDNSFAALRNGFKKVGKIDDISINGMGFSFLKHNTEVDTKDHYSQIDIFNSGKSESGLHLSNLPCRIVYEISDTSPEKGFCVQMSRCGLQFVDLAKDQLEQLELFLEKYTSGVLGT